MSKSKVKVAVVGASGYTGQELLRYLLLHTRVDLVALTSRQETGRLLSEVFPRFSGRAGGETSDLKFMEPDVSKISATGAKFAFLALPHGVAWEFVAPLLEAGFRIVDLSDDFRLNSAEVYEEFHNVPHPAPQLLKSSVYGLVESNRPEIEPASLVAAPGCYPTSILTPLLPLVRSGLIQCDSITVASMSGASGAGKKANPSLLFAEVNESVKAYNAPKHRHLAEIEQELSIAAGQNVIVSFVPHILPMTAGIATTVFAKLDIPATEASQRIELALKEAYDDTPFVRLLGENRFADTKNVVRTNFVDIGWVVDDRTDRVVLFSTEDNLGKGAAGQAVQCFNVMNQFPESEGLLHF